MEAFSLLRTTRRYILESVRRRERGNAGVGSGGEQVGASRQVAMTGGGVQQVTETHRNRW